MATTRAAASAISEAIQARRRTTPSRMKRISSGSAATSELQARERLEGRDAHAGAWYPPRAACLPINEDGGLDDAAPRMDQATVRRGHRQVPALPSQQILVEGRDEPHRQPRRREASAQAGGP